MVEIYESEKPKIKAYGLNPITQKTFLTSLCNDYSEGVLCQVKRHSSIFQDRWTRNPSVYIVIEVISQMENCLAIEIEDGHYKKTLDEMGEERDVYTTMDATFHEVSILFKLEEGKKPNQYKIEKGSPAYPFFAFATKEKGLLDEDYEGSFDMTFDEIHEVTERLEFIATAMIDNSGFKPRHILIPKRPETVILHKGRD